MAVALDLKEIGYVLLVILVLGAALLFFSRQLEEGFTGDMIRCGVDHAPCPGHLKCINGFCAKTDPVPVKEEEPVPLLPPGSPAPYF